MLVPKEIIRSGSYWYADADTGLPRKLVVTPEGVKRFCDTGNQMLAAGLSIPVPLEHQPDARPLTAAEKAAKQLLNNAGWVQKYELKGDALFGILDIPDPEIAKKLPHTIRYTSPWINSFTDGDGRNWDGVISHVALTSRPRITKQQPFADVKVAMSLAADLSPSPLGTPPADGFALSLAGLLTGEGATLKPLYPVAFSLWTGVKLADGDIPPDKPKPKAKPNAAPAKENEKPESTPANPSGAAAPGNAPVPAVGPDGQPIMESLVDPDGDISVWDVICDLLSCEGYDFPEGTDGTNFGERAYKVLMEKNKAKGQTPEAPMSAPNNQPSVGPNNQLPQNPIIQEQPPLYMSLEEVNKITDPNLKRVASMALSLQQNAMAQAKVQRDRKIEQLARSMSAKARDTLLEHAKSAKFSLEADGKVVDSLQPMLDMLDAQIAGMPPLLQRGAQFSEQPHPKDYGPELPMDETRRQEVVAEIARNSHLPKPAQPAA